MALAWGRPVVSIYQTGQNMQWKQVTPDATRIGWIGTGVMGRWMCEHCIRAGYSVRVHNRTVSRTEPLRNLGAVVCDTPRAVAEGSDVVFTIVGLPSDVRQVILGPAGVLAGMRPGGIVVDMTTSKPSLAVEIDAAAGAAGVAGLDAPVSGGDIGAREARLAIMVGGSREAYDAVHPLLSCMGKTITYMGGPGQGQNTKMVNQILIAGTMIGMVEGLLYAVRAGLDPTTVINVVGSGAAGSWSINNLGPRIVKGNYDPGFMVDHFVKDMGIALAEAERMDLILPGLKLVHELYTRMQAQGGGRLGTHALMRVVADMNRDRIRDLPKL